MAETESRSMIVVWSTNHPVIIVLQLRGSRLCESNLRIGPYHLVDNVLGPAGNVRKSRTHEFRTTHNMLRIESRVCASPDAT